MARKYTTIEGLAEMVNVGFGDIKSDIKGLRKEMTERFDRMEKLILADHTRRIERLEAGMQDLRDLLAIK